MRICPVCNKQNENGSYCTQCGALLTENSYNEIEFDVERNPDVVERPSVMKYAMIVIAAIICCALAVVLLQKKVQIAEPSITKKNTEKFVRDILDSQTVGVDDNSGTEQSGENTENIENTKNIENTENIGNLANEGYILPDSGSRYLDKSEIQHLSKEELRLARNEVYARHGRRFDDVSLQEYFNSKAWYSGTIAPSDFTESMLNEYEIQNTRMISDYEKEMGYR